MCGIAGILGRDCPQNAQRRVELALKHLRYRGPDSHGVAALPTGFLGVSRLAIVGPLHEKVPVTHRDSGAVLAFNGEVYLDENRTSWQQVTSGLSDTQRLSTRIEGLGLAKALKGIDADFAVANWSSASGKITLTRDGWGRRPLYYRWVPGLLVFASDIRALEIMLDAPLRQCTASVESFLSHRGLGPRGTPFLGVESVAPAEVLTWDGDAVSPPLVAHLEVHMEPRRVAGTLASRLDAASRSRLIDRRPSVLLSGGVDSTLLAERLAPMVDSLDLLTWSDGGQSDEQQAAAATAARLGFTVRPVRIEAAEFVDTVLTLARTTGIPAMDPSEAVIALLVREAASRTVLMGEGADELFGGYRYLRQQLEYLDRTHGRGPTSDEAIRRAFLSTRSIWSPAQVSRLLGSDEESARADLLDGRRFAAGRRQVALAASQDPNADATVRRAAKLTELYLTLHLPDLVSRADRAAMLTSREARLPFLADDLTSTVIYANGPRFNRLVLDGTNDAADPTAPGTLGKPALRRLLGDRSYALRPKIGFALPVGRWLRSERGTVLDIIREGSSRGGILDPQYAVEVASRALASSERSAGMQVFLLMAVAALEV